MREKSRQFLDQWLGVTNDFLQKHTGPPYGAAVREAAESVDLVLWVYSDGDNWPVDETIALFTKQLRTYYADNPQDATVQSPSDLLPAVAGHVADPDRAGHGRDSRFCEARATPSPAR